MMGRKQVAVSAVGLCSFALCVGAEFVVYRLTQNRVAEAATAVVGASTIGSIVLRDVRSVMRPAAATETASLRLNYVLQILLAVIFVFGLFTELRWTTKWSFEPLHDLNVAMHFAIVALAPFTISLVRRRYLQAKALEDSATPDRWQTYNERLARGG